MDGSGVWKLSFALPLSPDLRYNTATFSAGSDATIRAAGNSI